MCALRQAPSLYPIAPAYISAQPQWAYSSPCRGIPDYSIYLLAYHLLLSCLKTYISISPHTKEVNVILTMANYPSF
jgi:hypothetical protein